MGAPAKSGSLDRNRIKERRESFISYSKEELFQNEEKPSTNPLDCEKPEDLSVEKEEAARSKSESRDSDDLANKSESETLNHSSSTKTTQKPEIKQYNSKTLPKRIATLKKNRAKTLKETSKFYMDVNEEETDTILKIVEPQDREEQENLVNESLEGQKEPKRKDSEIISQLILQNSEIKRKLSKPTIVRRKSMDAPEKPTVKPTLELPLIPPLPPKEKKQDKLEKQETEPIYESLLRNVHVPYKFAPPMLRRSPSNQSNQSTSPLAASSPSIKGDTVDQVDQKDTEDGSDCDYVTLTYNENDLVAVDGEEVKRSPPSPAAARINHEIMMMSTSDTNINYGKNLVQEVSGNFQEDPENLDLFSLERRGSLSGRSTRSLLQRFMGLRITEPQNEETLSQKSISTTASRKSLDSGVLKANGSEFSQIPHIYRQGSEDLGSRIANVDYADPKTLFPSAANILINKAALKSQRDSVFSSSSDSVCENQKQLMEDSYYEQSVEDCLENDFRDSAVYSDDNGRLESMLSPEQLKEEHIYAQVVKKVKSPPIVPKKPSLLVKPLPLSPPPVPIKPTGLKSPDIKKVILSYRNSSNLPVNTSRLSAASSKSAGSLTPEISDGSSSPKGWVLQQVQKFQ